MPIKSQNLPCAARRSAWSIAVFALVLALLLLLGAARQGAAQVPGGTRPDVQIVVMGHPTGQWAVSVVYPRVVSKAVMQNHLKRLLAVSGWKASGKPEFETRGIRKNDGRRIDRAGATDPPMSSVTFLTASPVVDWQNSVLPVEPFARAFRDLNRVYVTFFVPGRFPFRGLRRHSDQNLDVALTEDGGAYTYILNIKNHNLEALDLPRFQVTVPPEKVRSASVPKKAETQRLVGTALVVLLAAVAGSLMYVWANRWSAR